MGWVCHMVQITMSKADLWAIDPLVHWFIEARPGDPRRAGDAPLSTVLPPLSPPRRGESKHKQGGKQAGGGILTAFSCVNPKYNYGHHCSSIPVLRSF